MGNTIEVRIRTIVWAATSAALAVAATLLISSAWSADAAPGDLDSTYVPTAGCRLFDLRAAPNQVGPRPTPLGAGEVYTQQITGNVGNCTGPFAIPAEAVAVSMNVTAVNSTAQTNLRLFPADLTEVPTLSNLNVSAGQAPFPNKVDVALSPSGAIKIFNQNGSVSVLGDIVGYYTKSSLTEIDARLAALEANDGVQDGAIASNADGVAELDAAQPFTKVSETVANETAQSTPTNIRSVQLTAPVDGHVAAFATGEMNEGDDGNFVECAVMDSVSEPPPGDETSWQSPTGGDFAHLSVSQVFEIAAGETATYYLVCKNASGEVSVIWSPRLTAIFTPAP